MKSEHSAFIEPLTYRPFKLDKSRSYSYLEKGDRWRDREAIEQDDSD